MPGPCLITVEPDDEAFMDKAELVPDCLRVLGQPGQGWGVWKLPKDVDVGTY